MSIDLNKFDRPLIKISPYQRCIKHNEDTYKQNMINFNAELYFHFGQVEWELGRGFYSLIEQYMHSITSYKKVNGILRK